MKNWIIAIAVAIALVASNLATHYIAKAKTAQWQAKADVALAEVDSLRQVIVQRDAFLETSVPKTTARITAVRARVAALPVAPKECDPIAAPRDSIIAEQDSIIADVVAERDTAQAQAADFGRIADVLQPLVEHPPLPSFGTKFLKAVTPEVGFGGAVGVDPETGKFAKVVGVTFSWRPF